MGDGFRRASVRRDQPEQAAGEIDQLRSVAAPAHRVGQFVVDRLWRPKQPARRIDVGQMQPAGEHERHPLAIRRPHRPVVAAGAERLVRRDRLIGPFAAVDIDGEDLAQPLAKACRIGLERRIGDGLAVRAPGRFAGLPDVAIDLPDHPAGDLDDMQRAILVEKGDLRTVARPGAGDSGVLVVG